LVKFKASKILEFKKMSNNAGDVKNSVEVSNYDLFSNLWLIIGIAGSIGILVVLVILFVKWSNSETTKEFDKRVSKMLSTSLASKLNTSESDIIALLTRTGSSELIPKMKTLVDSVNVTASRSAGGKPLEVTATLKYKDGTSSSARSIFSFDDLPEKVREDLIRSEGNIVKCSWSLPS